MPANDDLDLLHELAERLGLDESESENFITSSMRRLGHKPRIDWDDAEEGGEGGGSGDFFGKQRERRQVQKGKPRREGQGSQGWQYERSS